VATTGVKVLEKALLILSQFFDHDEISLKELEELTELNRTTIYRILQVYTKWGFLEQDAATKKYKVSLKMLEISGTALRKLNFLNISRPYLLNLRDKTGESAFLAVLDGPNTVVVDWERSYFNAQINVTVGKIVPAYCTGTGKAILAFLPPDELEAYLSALTIEKYTEKTVPDKDTLREVLRVAAEKGYGMSFGEYDSDIVVAAAPIFNVQNRVVAACAVAALASRVTSVPQVEEYGVLVKKAAAEISKKLGSTRF
jgi:DNA-binding IclR family transcriptional regulator